MKKKILALVVAIALGAAVLVPAGSVYADGPNYTCSSHFLGLRAWYDGLLESDTPDEKTGECKVISPEKLGGGDKEAGMRKFVWTLVMNVISMIFGIVGYLAIGFVMWGGFQYILAQGDVTKTMRGKKTVTNAIIGLALVMTASIISNVISGIISGARNSGDKFFLEIFNSAFLWAGIITGIMIVWGGIQYTTSLGDPQKATKAKNTLLYSIIGLVIVILAATIVNTVVNGIQGGGE